MDGLPAWAVVFWQIIVECINISSGLTFVADLSFQSPVVAERSNPEDSCVYSEKRVSATNTDVLFQEDNSRMSFKKRFPLRHNTKKKGMSSRC